MKKLSFLFITALATIVGFASCSSDNDNDGGTPNPSGGKTKQVNLSVSIGSNTQLRADGPSATTLTPDVADLTLYFYDDVSGNILSTQQFPITGFLPTGTTTKTFDVPENATKIYAIGNTISMTGSVTLPASVTTVTDLKTALINIGKQTHPKNGVNVKGEANIVFTAPGSPNTASLELRAAVARIEVAKITSVAEANVVVTPLTSFKVSNIFINNTYSKFPLNEVRPTTGFEFGTHVFNYDVSLWGATYPSIYDNATDGAFYHDKITAPTAGISHVPSGAVWGYFVPATFGTNNGTILPNPAGGSPAVSSDRQGNIPHIIIEITDAQATGITIPAKQYVTVKGLKDMAGVSITNLKGGFYYLIKELNIGAEHLSTNPEEPKEKLEVTVEVKPWEEVEVKPEF